MPRLNPQNRLNPIKPNALPLPLLLIGALLATGASPAGSVAGPAAQGTVVPAATPVPTVAPGAVGPGAPPRPGRPTALLVTATNAPAVLPGSDGLVHLEYDLLVTNAFPAPVELTAVDVLGPDGAPLLRLAGDALAGVTEGVFLQAPVTPARQIPVSGAVSVVVDVPLPADRVPATLTHRLTYDLPADAPALTLLVDRTVDGPELAVDAREPVVIAPPLRGPGWLSANGCCRPNLHRSLRVPLDGRRLAKGETFAVDWTRLRDGRYFEGDGARNEQHFAYGAEVLAVGDATVTYVWDGLPEEAPYTHSAHVKVPVDYAGNQVVLELAPGVWAFYAHLQPGSLRVRQGERVAAGQVLGLLGNSGSTTNPHLHFGLMDEPDAILATSLPFVLDGYTLAGDLTPEALQAAFGGDTPQPVAVSGPPRAQTRTHPLVYSVADLP